MTNGKTRILSGIQPSGRLHLGNYLGAVRQWVEGQDQCDSFICIVDLHALTSTRSRKELAAKTRQLAAMLIACGIDPKKTTLFVQSHVTAHTEAWWLLSSLAPLGWLKKMTQFKSKRTERDNPTGLLLYPVLQAADILLYDADVVPVGEDQLQHIELCRDMAQAFNSRFGPTFKLPKAVTPESGARVMGFDDPSRKMSKSTGAAYHAVMLDDSDERIARTVDRAQTTGGGRENLEAVYRAVCGLSFRPTSSGRSLKEALTEELIRLVSPIRSRYRDLMNSPHELEGILSDGAARARLQAEDKLRVARRRMGLLEAACQGTEPGHSRTRGPGERLAGISGRDDRLLFRHDDALWQRFPVLSAAAIVVRRLSDGKDVEHQLESLYKQAERRLAEAGTESGFPEIRAWRAIFKEMGLKPRNYRCAAEALLRRLRTRGDIPRFHSLVDVCNAVSVAYAIPIAVFDIDKIQFPVIVTFSEGSEAYEGFGGRIETPERGEVIFRDSSGKAHSRRWTFRQSSHSLVGLGTRSALVIAEAVHLGAEGDLESLVATLINKIEEAEIGDIEQHRLLSRVDPGVFSG